MELTVLKEMYHRLCNGNGDFTNKSMEMRLFHSISLLAAVLSLFVIIPTNIYQHLPLAENIAIFLFGIGCSILYGLAGKGTPCYTILYVMIITVLNAVWFFNGASAGSVIFYFFGAIIYAMVFFRARKRSLLLWLLIVDGLLLLISESYLPGLVVHFKSHNDRILDLTAGFATCAAGCILMMRAVLSEYDQEKTRLKNLNTELDKRILEIKTLQGILPICAWCKKVLDDEGLWKQLELYITEHSGAEFSHGMCPECRDAFMKEHKLTRKPIT
jgi:hypothetical protein